MTEKLMLGTLAAPQATALKNRLAKAGIEVALVHNQVTCNKGCALQLEVWAHPADTSEISKLLSHDAVDEMTSMGYDPKLLGQVFDASAEEVTCPACGATFKPTTDSCPECELCFGVPDAPKGHGCR